MALYEKTIKRESSLDKPDKIQEAYENILLEGTDEAKRIREAIKKQFKLTNRDVSVRARSGSMSSAVNVDLKSVKALPFKKKIAEIGKGQEHYQRDQASGSILGGGNTFVFVELDYKFRDKLIKKIEMKILQAVTGDYMNDIGSNVIKVYDDYGVVKPEGKTEFWITHPKKSTVGHTHRSVIEAAGGVLSLMLDLEDSKNLKKLG